jgi:cation diffusion facilitator family transporter
VAPSPEPPSRRRVVVVSFLVDLFDVVSNLIVALITGSAVVFAEMAQGIADSVGSGFLVIGDRRARRPRDPEHPHGFEREAFFWAALSAVAMLLIGAGLSAWRGIRQLTDPGELSNSPLAIGVLALAIVTNGYAVALSVRNLRGSEGTVRAALRSAHRPLVKSALLRDVIGTTTSIVGLVALVLYAVFGNVEFDAAGALVAAVMMAIAAVILLAQARELIAGRALPDVELARLRAAVIATPGVVAINDLVAIHAGAEDVQVDVDVDLDDDLDTTQIEVLLDEIEARVRAEMPEVSRFQATLNPKGIGTAP